MDRYWYNRSIVDIQQAQLARMWASKEAKLADFLIETKHLATEKKKPQPVSHSWDDFTKAVQQLPCFRKS